MGAPRLRPPGRHELLEQLDRRGHLERMLVPASPYQPPYTQAETDQAERDAMCARSMLRGVLPRLARVLAIERLDAALAALARDERR
jgi:hypothetical protein